MRTAAALLIAASLCGCSALLPRSTVITESPWSSYADAEAAFERIVAYKTTAEDLKALNLDPRQNANMTLLNYSDVLKRFVPSPTIDAKTLDRGVRECIEATSACRGVEVEQRVVHRNRYGNFWADFLNFRRKVDVEGWRFNGVILLKDDLVVYKLSGGQPAIREQEEAKNPLGPLQGIGESRLLNAF